MGKVFNETTRRMEPEENLYKVPVPNKPWQFKYYTSQEEYNRSVINKEYSERIDLMVQSILGKEVWELPGKYKKEINTIGKEYGFEATFKALSCEENKIRFVASQREDTAFMVNYIIKLARTNTAKEAKRIKNSIVDSANVLIDKECHEPAQRTPRKHDISRFLTEEDDD